MPLEYARRLAPGPGAGIELNSASGFTSHLPDRKRKIHEHPVDLGEVHFFPDITKSGRGTWSLRRVTWQTIKAKACVSGADSQLGYREEKVRLVLQARQVLPRRGERIPALSRVCSACS